MHRDSVADLLNTLHNKCLICIGERTERAAHGGFFRDDIVGGSGV